MKKPTYIAMYIHINRSTTNQDKVRHSMLVKLTEFTTIRVNTFLQVNTIKMIKQMKKNMQNVMNSVSFINVMCLYVLLGSQPIYNQYHAQYEHTQIHSHIYLTQCC